MACVYIAYDMNINEIYIKNKKNNRYLISLA